MTTVAQGMGGKSAGATASHSNVCLHQIQSFFSESPGSQNLAKKKKIHKGPGMGKNSIKKTAKGRETLK